MFQLGSFYLVMTNEAEKVVKHAGGNNAKPETAKGNNTQRTVGKQKQESLEALDHVMWGIPDRNTNLLAAGPLESPHLAAPAETIRV